MPIAADRSNLPSTPDPSQGVAPDADDAFLVDLVTTWLDVFRPDDEELELAIPEAGPLRASWAGMCARRISYELTPEDAKHKAPLTLADRWRFAIGTLVHNALQSAKPDSYREEVNVDLNPIGVKGSAHVDLVGDDAGGIAVEIKSINGTGFKRHATKDRGPAEGPRISAILQGGLAGLAAGLSELRVLYLSLENAAPWHVERNGYNPESPAAAFGAQWTFDLETLRPRIEREAKRLAKILALVEKGELAPRALVDEDVPASATVVDPSKGRWEVLDKDGQVVSTGSSWQCDYCPFQAHCAADPR